MLSPGVTSKILWHFTGGPYTDPTTGRQLKEPKPEEEALNHLLSILKEGRIRANEGLLCYGQYEVHLPPFCCVAEIPIQHLRYHSERYGKFALGFRRRNLREKKFRPVHYVIGDADSDFVLPSILDVWYFLDFQLSADRNAKEKSMLEGVMKKQATHMCFLKSFLVEESDSVYAEREWRVLGDFVFDPEDLCFIICPEDFLERVRPEVPEKYSKIPLASFEDLVEH